MSASAHTALWKLLAALFICQVLSQLIAARPSAHPCSDCPAGQGVIQPCNASQDTLCQACPPGRYSPDASSDQGCLACSRCGDGLFELHPCTAKHDLFCELCSWITAPDNEDYIKKCTVSNTDRSEKPEETDVSRHHGQHKGALRQLIANGPFQKLRHKGKSHGRDFMLGDSGAAELRGGDTPIDIDTDLIEDLPLKEHRGDQELDIKDGETEKESHVKDGSPINTSEDGEKIEEETKPAEIKPGEDEGVVITESYNHNADDADLDSKDEAIPELYGPDQGITGGTHVPDEVTTHRLKNPDIDAIPELYNNVTETKQEFSADITTAASLQTAPNNVQTDNEFQEGVSSSPTLNPSETVGTMDFVEGETDETVEGSGGSGGSGAVDIPGDNELPDFTVHIISKKTTKWGHHKPKSTPYPLLDDDDDDADEDFEDVEPEVQASTAENEVPVVGIIIAVITCAIIFFALGFFANRYRLSRKARPGTPKPEYKPQVSYTQPNGLSAGQHKMSNLNGRSNESGSVAYDEPDVPMMAPVYEEETEALTTADQPHIGKYQSPVDIDPEDADIDDRLEKNPLTMKYTPENTKSMTNTGHTVRVDIDGRDSVLSGGPFESKKYRLDHFHFHWGKENNCGSEHTVRGQQFSAELHLVHWNAEDYPSFAEAAKGEDGLAVIAVLIKVDNNEHAGMKTLTDCLPSIQYKGESRELPENRFDPKVLFPKNTVDYWTYMGSLTTPPYYETVTWVIMKEAISVTQDQIDKFRNLLTYERGEGHLVKDRDQAYMGNNFRKTLPLEDRVVHASFV